MGVLIFAYRKLSLKRQLNQDSYRLEMLTMEKNSVTRQIGLMQQSMADKQDMAQQMMGNISNIFYAGTQMQTGMARAGVQYAEQNVAQAMEKARKSGVDPSKDKDVLDAQKALGAAQSSMSETQMGSMQAFNIFQTRMLAANQEMNSVFMAKDKGAMQGLKSKENRLDTEMANLTSVITQEKAELQAVEKEEGEEAKNSAPKFGL